MNPHQPARGGFGGLVVAWTEDPFIWIQLWAPTLRTLHTPGFCLAYLNCSWSGYQRNLAKTGEAGPRRTPALWLMFWAYLWHAGLCGWPVGTRDSAVVVSQRSCYVCETRHSGDLAVHQPLSHLGLAWKTRTTLNLQMGIQFCDNGARKDRRNKVAW